MFHDDRSVAGRNPWSPRSVGEADIPEGEEHTTEHAAPKNQAQDEIDRNRTDLSRGIVDGEIAIDVSRSVQD